ncbi:trimeric intracellular cation channel family protein [Hahella sp. SMD15-11]|uniref:Trimeric intracellular cation channel family protein n=1 Tax=Thermohahella caldifontis TaxID=3142973 RepID=A0AB39UVP5_9GAMM
MFAFLDFFGLTVFAISGALEAGRRRFDLFGVLVVAFVTALGGGTLRDLILNAHPVSWLANTHYLNAALLAGLGTFLWARAAPIPMRALEVADAIGLAFFTVSGAQKALSLGHDVEVAMIMGMTTGVAGGVIRDILCNEIPLIFHKEIYATPALLGALAYVYGTHLGWGDLAAWGGMLVTLLLRLAGIYFGWSLPAFLSVSDTSAGRDGGGP